MTAGEMLQYTKRFNEIVDSNAPKHIKGIRLSNLMTDLEMAYNIPMLRNKAFEKQQPFVMQLYCTVSLARPL
ncbi:hypothetical protein LC040_12320 [Bacillus tianshenii]|nr:hypothetical protein LC040_12320 [Bacillus tianshenii]